MTGKAAPVETTKFGFLAKHDVQLPRLGALATQAAWIERATKCAG
jgi:hypothetical protein